MHNEGQAKEALLWCLKTGTGDAGFYRKRNDLIAAVTAKNAEFVINTATDMLTHDDGARNNLIAANNEDQGSALRWSRQIMGLPD